MQVQITAINPDFDRATIQKLKSRKQVVPISTLSGKAKVEDTITPSPSEVPPADNALTPSTITPAPSAVVPAPTQATQPQPTISNIPVTVNGQ